MRSTLTAASLTLTLVLAPHAARAQAAADGARPEATAQASAGQPGATTPWSLGAGAGYSLYGISMGFVGYGINLTPLPAPSARASLERAVAPGWWLVFGAEGSANRARGDAPAGSSLSTRGDASWFGASVGVRRALTRPGAAVTVSTDLLARASYAWSRADVASSPPQTLRGEAWRTGLSAGLAVERELTSGISLRVATPLVAVEWGRATTDASVSGKATSEGGGVSLALAPSLELRLAF